MILVLLSKIYDPILWIGLLNSPSQRTVQWITSCNCPAGVDSLCHDPQRQHERGAEGPCVWAQTATSVGGIKSMLNDFLGIWRNITLLEFGLFYSLTF